MIKVVSYIVTVQLYPLVDFSEYNFFELYYSFHKQKETIQETPEF